MKKAAKIAAWVKEATVGDGLAAGSRNGFFL